MSNVVHWINLTNGIQAIRDYSLSDYRVMRLQSTYCEQKRFEDILMQIPDEFLFNLALGNDCRVYDYGTRKPIPRAVWQGLTWVSYALTRRWTGEIIKVYSRNKFSMNDYFNSIYDSLSKRTFNRLDYYGDFSVGAPIITSVTSPTDKDYDKIFLIDHFIRHSKS